MNKIKEKRWIREHIELTTMNHSGARVELLDKVPVSEGWHVSRSGTARGGIFKLTAWRNIEIEKFNNYRKEN